MPARPRAHRTEPGQPDLTKTQRLAMERLLGHVHELGFHGLDAYVDLPDKIPEAWDTLTRDVDVDEPREKVTLYLDRSVARFWRAQGRGYQERVNRVLATYAQMQIAEVNAANEWWRKRREERRLERIAEAEARAEREANGEA